MVKASKNLPLFKDFNPDEAVDILFFESTAFEQGYKTIAGVDEVGRGPLAGPVVAAAVVLPPGVTLPGIKDSKKMTEDHLVIMTFWKSFEQHEKSHADAIFKEKFTELAEFCDETYELGYEMLWQGTPE